MPSEPLPIRVPGIRCIRFRTHELYSGIKDSYTIGHVDTGRSEWWARGRTWSSGPGTISLKQPGDVHRDLRRDGDSTVQVVVLSPKLVEAACDGARSLRLRVPQLDPEDPRARPFHRLHRAIAAAAEPLALEVAVAEATAAFARELTGDEGADPRASWQRPVRRAVDLLHARFAEPLDLDTIAAHAGLDKFHLCRAFRAQVGFPPHAYRTHVRIAHAKALLAAGVPAGEVAARVGLCDQSQLNRHFTRIVGTTPARFARARIPLTSTSSR
jgi:AraC-like DNA-binding protein